MLQDSVRRALERHFSLDPLRAMDTGSSDRDESAWQTLCELGIPGLMVPEAHGGLGLGLMEALLVAEELGRHPVGAPFLGSVVLAPLVLQLAGTPEQQARWLPALADGRQVMGVALQSALAPESGAAPLQAHNGRLSGKAIAVVDATGADAFIVSTPAGGLYLLAANAPGLEVHRLPQVDASRPLHVLTLDNAPAEALPLADAQALARLRAAAWTVLAADTLGAGWAMIDQSVNYARDRRQFGRVIGSYQAVKHMCAEMAASLEPSRALIWQAAMAWDARDEQAELLAAHAKAHTSEVGTVVARTATEVHGGIGITDLLGLHFWLKRVGWNRQIAGTPHHLRRWAARLQGWPSAEAAA